MLATLSTYSATTDLRRLRSPAEVRAYLADLRAG
jgi:hypothetical protein